jgi:amphi-Trp domain-containing protein
MAKKDRDSTTKDASPRRAASFSAEVDTAEAAAYLEGLARDLRNNRLVVRDGAESLDVAVAPRVALDLEAKSARGGKKHSLKLRLNWSKRYEVQAGPDSTGEDEEVAPPEAAEPASEPAAEEAAAEENRPPDSTFTSGAE